MTIVVFCPNLIGDTVMATPMIRAIRRRYADARLVSVLKPAVAPTLAGLPWFDDQILFHPRSSRPEERSFAVIRRLRAERADWAILLPNSFRSALMARLASIPRRIGYARGGRSLLLTDRLAPPRDPRGRFLPTPIVEYYLGLARHLGCPVDSLRTELATTEADETAADSAWSNLGLFRDERVICLNTGGAFGPAKNWPIPHFVRLARRLADEAGARVLVLCGPGERDHARAIVQQSDHPRIVSLAEQPMSLGLSKACVRRCELLITTDSGPRHFAAAFDVPVISLFGPTHVAWTRTNHPLAVHLQQPVPCGPCQKPVCPLGHHRCMQELSPDSVFQTAMRVFANRSSGRRAIRHSPRSTAWSELEPRPVHGPSSPSSTRSDLPPLKVD
jgi:heptosyltransferase-2